MEAKRKRKRRCLQFSLRTLLVAIMGVAAALPATPEDIGCLRRFCDPKTPDADAYELFRKIKDTRPADGEAEALAKVANSDFFATGRRRLAIYGLVERDFRSGKTMRQLADVLGKPTWLRKEHIHRVGDLGGKIPIDIVAGETVFVISLRWATNDQIAIFLRVNGEDVREDSVYDALMGNTSVATDLAVTAIVMWPSNGKLIDALQGKKDH